MNCKEILELVSSAVDNQLSEDERLILDSHLKVCPRCKREFELARTTKGLVSSVCHNYNAPDVLKEKIVHQINNLKFQNIATKPFLNYISNKYWYFILPLLVVIMIFIFTFRSGHNHPINLSENNILRITYRHFDEILNGNQTVLMETSDPLILEANLKANVGSHIFIPRLKNCQLLGGWTSEEFGKKFIHLLYSDKDELIYCSQLNYNDLIKDSQLYLDRNIVDKLKENGNFIHKDFECCSVIFWLYENQLCIFTSGMDTNKLLSHLYD